MQTAVTQLRAVLQARAGAGTGEWLRRLGERLENPVLGRESRARMRGARSHLVTGTYALLVCTFVLIAYAVLLNGAEQSGAVMTNQLASQVGRGIWTWGCLSQALLLPLIVPAFTCGGITIEREREMLELLLLTRQSALQICMGKWGSGVGLGLMLVLSSVPVLSLSLLLGGVAPQEMFETLAVLVTSVLAVGAFGLAASTLARKTTIATVMVYMVLGFLMVGMPALNFLMSSAMSMSIKDSELGILAMLAACMATAFAPALACAAGIYGLRRVRNPDPPVRAWWMGVTGLCWAGLLLVLYLPGMTSVLLQSQVLLMLHPAAAIHAVMDGDRFGLPVHQATVCSFTYLGLACWFMFIAVNRVKRMRAA